MAGLLPGVGRILLGPGREKLPVLIREVKAVGLRHVEHRAGNVTLHRVGLPEQSVKFDKQVGPWSSFYEWDDR